MTRQIGGHAETLAAIDTIHQPVDRAGELWCIECGKQWPCATRRLIGDHSRHRVRVPAAPFASGGDIRLSGTPDTGKRKPKAEAPTGTADHEPPFFADIADPGGPRACSCVKVPALGEHPFVPSAAHPELCNDCGFMELNGRHIRSDQ